jgi:uncharacterized membrane protein (DUF4010 family)
MGQAVQPQLGHMSSLDLFGRLALALAIGLLFGVERGWQEREAKSGTRAAGIRTFALVGLLGAIWGLLGQVAGSVVLGLAALGFAGWFGFFAWREEKASGSRSATGFIAGLLSFALGAYAMVGSKAAAGSVAVAATFILAERRALHGFLEKLKWIELRAALMLLVMTFVLLPVLPDRFVDPWGALNPHQLWLLTILTAAVSYAGYIAVKLAGPRNGPLYAGALGGLVSSTTVTWTFARMARQHLYGAAEATAGIAASWTLSLLRMAAIAIVLAPSLLRPLGLPVASAALVTTLASMAMYRRSSSGTTEANVPLTDPFDLWMILRFTAVLAAVMLAAKLLPQMSGQESLFGLAAVSGFADVDPITLSTAQAVDTSMAAAYGAVIILTAAGANVLAKAGLTAFFGGLRFALPLIATGIAAAMAAGAVLALQAVAG